MKLTDTLKSLKGKATALSDRFSGGIAKGTEALAGLTSGILKMTTGDPMQIASGVLDFASVIANFMPPPASLITGGVSQLLSLFSTTPTVQDVIKEEFQSLKNFIAEGLEAQKEYTKHIVELSQIDEMIRMSQSVMTELTMKLQFMSVFYEKEITAEISSEIRGELDMLSMQSDITIFKITYDDLCKK